MTIKESDKKFICYIKCKFDILIVYTVKCICLQFCLKSKLVDDQMNYNADK